MAADPAEQAAVQERLLPAYEVGADFLEPVPVLGRRDPAAALSLAERLAQMGGDAIPTALKLLLDAGLAQRAEAGLEEWGPQDEAALLVLARYFRTEAHHLSAPAESDGVGVNETEAGRLLNKSLRYYRRTAAADYPLHRSEVLTELADSCTTYGTVDEVLDARVGLLKISPSLEHWRAAMAAAAAADLQQAVKDELLSLLRNSAHPHFLCDVLIAEAREHPEHLTEAAKVAREADSTDFRYMVATAAMGLGDEAEQPIALELLQENAEQLALRGGDYAYDQAVSVAHLLKKHFPESWQEWLQAYVGRHRRRRNLLQALTRAGLYIGAGQ